MKRSWSLVLAAALTSGCGSFHAPPLPQAAANAPAPAAPSTDEAWATRLRAADVVYLSLTRNGLGAEQPLWQIIQVLQSHSQSVTLGWAELPATQQADLERWQREQAPESDALAQLLRPEHAALLRQTLRPDLAQAALGSSRELLAKISDGASLTTEEEANLPRGFFPSSDAFADFVDRVTTSSRLRRYNVRRLFRAHLVAEQTVAENIARWCRGHPDSKLLVLLPNDALINPREIAAFATQKMPLKQLILDRAEPLRSAQPKLVSR